jgi:NADH dehydrogenase
MMKNNCLIVGGGFAGLNAAITMSKELNKNYNIILMDKNNYHLRRVLLFKVATDGKEIRIPFKELLPENVQFIQGELLSINRDGKEISYQDSENQEKELKYDKLVLTLGSINKSAPKECGGISLTDIQAAKRIEDTWQYNFEQAKNSENIATKRALLSMAVVGAGITGIETATELSYAMRNHAKKTGIDANLISIYLINSKSDIFEEATPHIRRSIRKEIEKCGVTIIDNRKGIRFENNTLLLNEYNEMLSVGGVIWTMGVKSNPIINTLDIPTTLEGKIIVNQNYRVESDIYSIGDCAHVIDFRTGKVDGMTCKEAVPQAHRLIKIFKAELKHKQLPQHKSYTSLFCISMGPNNGIFWMKLGKWNILLKRKLGWLMRGYTWNLVSLQKGVKT